MGAHPIMCDLVSYMTPPYTSKSPSQVGEMFRVAAYLCSLGAHLDFSLIVDVSITTFVFQPGKSTIQPLFCLRMLQEKHRVWKGAACGVCGPGKGLRQGAKGTNLVLAQTKRGSRGIHKHNPGHVCWVQDKRHDQCGKDQRNRD